MEKVSLLMKNYKELERQIGIKEGIKAIIVNPTIRAKLINMAIKIEDPSPEHKDKIYNGFTQLFGVEILSLNMLKENEMIPFKDKYDAHKFIEIANNLSGVGYDLNMALNTFHLLKEDSNFELSIMNNQGRF